MQLDSGLRGNERNGHIDAGPAPTRLSRGTASACSTSAMPLDIVEHQHRQLRLRQRAVGGDGDDAIVVRIDAAACQARREKFRVSAARAA